MAIICNQKVMMKENYIDENELQKYLFEHPELLQNETDSQFHALKREVYLKNAGKLDILLIDDNGCPVAVEVKLERNSQARREVVAQIFDYISDISELDYHELDEMLGGKLDEFAENTGNQIGLPKIVNSFLKSGMTKVIIAIDEVNDDLIRIMDFINKRTNLDVRLISVRKYDQGNTLIPQLVVNGKEEEADLCYNRSGSTRFEEFVNYYNSLSKEELKTRNNSPGYRQFRRNDWNSLLHYEIYDKKRKNSIGIEFHIEKDDYPNLKAVISQFFNMKVLDKAIFYDDKWAKNRGRIFIDLPYSLDNEKMFEYAQEFIVVNAGLIFPLLSGEIFPVLGKNIIRSQRLRPSSVPSFCRNRPASSVCGSDAAACRA